MRLAIKTKTEMKNDNVPEWSKGEVCKTFVSLVRIQPLSRKYNKQDEPGIKRLYCKGVRFTSHQKYYKYIEEYVSNLTPIQVDYWRAWKDGGKTIW